MGERGQQVGRDGPALRARRAGPGGPRPLGPQRPPLRLPELPEVDVPHRGRDLAGDRDPAAAGDGVRDDVVAVDLNAQMRRALMPSVPSCSKKPGKLLETHSGSRITIPGDATAATAKLIATRWS